MFLPLGCNLHMCNMRVRDPSMAAGKTLCTKERGHLGYPSMESLIVGGDVVETGKLE